MNPCFLLKNTEQTSLAGGTRVGIAHRRQEETWRLSVRPLETVLRGACAAMYDKLRRSRRLDAVQSGCSALSIVKQGDLMVVANVGDSRVVLGTAFDDDAITSSSSLST
jgi:serine/threonine protein phosphatase PrpC